MKVLIIKDLSKFPIKATLGGVWKPTNNTVSSDYWLQLEAEQDLIDNGISYTIGEIEIKQETE
jgi:hypothetical protein